MSKRNLRQMKIEDLFEVRSGDFHAIKELDAGNTPLVSCGDLNNGVVGYYDIPAHAIYINAITVAYNGSWPLTAKYHPYQFGAKDDVGVLVPRSALKPTTLLYVAASLNRMTWRYSYGRKCFQQKLCKVQIPVPVIKNQGAYSVDEDQIESYAPKNLYTPVTIGSIAVEIRIG